MCLVFYVKLAQVPNEPSTGTVLAESKDYGTIAPLNEN